MNRIALWATALLGLSLPSCRPPPIRQAVHTLPSNLEARSGKLNMGAFSPLKNSNQRPSDLPGDRAKRPFDLRAFYEAVSLGAPAFSPDGERVLLPVTSYDLEGAKSNPDIYLVELDTGVTRRMTTFDGADTSPLWAADGKSFYFLSSREDGSQLWQMPAFGGEPRRLSRWAVSPGSPQVLRDGRVVFVAEVFPDLGAELSKQKEGVDKLESNPFFAHVADHLLFRHWDSYRDGKRQHLFLMDPATDKTTDLTPGDFDSPIFPGFGHDFDVSPDGQELAFVSNRDGANTEAWTTNADILTVPLSGGPTVNLTSANAACDNAPLYSRDGTKLAYVLQTVPGYESDRPRIAVRDRATGRTLVYGEKFDERLRELRFGKGEESLVFSAEVRGRVPLFELDLATGDLRRVPGIASVRDFDVSAKGDIVFTFNSVATPTELYVLRAGSTEPRKLTHFHDALVQRYDIRPVEELWIKGPKGRKIHVFVVKPHGFDPGKKYPLVLNVHGGPQYQWADSFRGDWQVYPAAGYVVAFPNTTGSTGYGHDFTAAISRDWGGRVYEETLAVTEALSKLAYVDSTKMGAMGWSYGGYMMNWLLGHEVRFAAIASTMGLFDLRAFYGATEELWFPEWDIGGTPWDNPKEYAQFDPAAHIASMKTPTLIITGEKDYRVPYTQSIELFTALRRREIPARLVIFPSDGHWPSLSKGMPLYYAAHLDWFHRYLGGEPSPIDPHRLVRGTGFVTDKAVGK
jgi:dipeptidyl aminopeptidase/acylaminoacyl peptidase